MSGLFLVFWDLSFSFVALHLVSGDRIDRDGFEWSRMSRLSTVGDLGVRSYDAGRYVRGMRNENELHLSHEVNVSGELLGRKVVWK